MYKLIIGSHVSLNAKNKYLVGSVLESIANDANAMMIYTGTPQTSNRVELSNFNIPQALELMNQNNFSTDNIVVHAPYIVNYAASNYNKHRFAVDFTIKEVERTAAMHSKYLVIHPGSHVDADLKVGIANAAKCINEIIAKTKNVIICIETMAGKGTQIGKTFNEIKAMIDLVQDKSRVGVCLDTCHIHDAGYNIHNPDAIIEEFDQVIGLKYLYVIHCNDSENEQGSKKDRHANLGYGKIGFNTLIK